MKTISMPTYATGPRTGETHGWSETEIRGVQVQLAPEHKGRRQMFLKTLGGPHIYNMCCFVRVDHLDEDIEFFVVQYLRVAKEAAERSSR